MARAFRFRLQRVLDLREHELEARRLELAHALAAERAGRERLEAARDERSARDAQFSVVDDRPLSPLDLEARRASTVAMQRLEERLQQDATALAQSVERARQAAVEAQRQVQVMERLRDKAHATWQHEIDAQEKRNQDDIQSRYGDDPLD